MVKIALFKFSILILFSFHASARGAQVEYIPQSKVDSLNRLFDGSPKMSSEKIDDLRAKPWVCKMYGIKSKIQVQSNLSLYDFINGPHHDDSVNLQRLSNDGSQVIKSYALGEEGLAGTNGVLKDEVRMINKKMLISKLSFIDKNHHPLQSQEIQQPNIVAFSVCN